MENRNILYDVFCDLETQTTKIGIKVYNWFQHDYMRAIIVSNNVWYYEVGTLWSMPSYVFNWLNKYMNRKYKVKYLYEVTR